LPRKYKLLDVLAASFSRCLPHKEPSFGQMDDNDFITILSWLEDWEPKKVYEVAYKHANLKPLQEYDDWCEVSKPFPPPMKAQLREAIELHQRNGNLHALRTYAWFYEYYPKVLWMVFILGTVGYFYYN